MEVFFGIGLAGMIAGFAVWYILQVIAYWKIFEKAGKPGWHSIIPVLNTYDQFDISWNGAIGIISLIGLGLASFLGQQAEQNQAMAIAGGVIGFVCFVIAVIEDYKLAKCFGKGIGTFIGLLFLSPIFMLILGFGDAEYVGKDN